MSREATLGSMLGSKLFQGLKLEHMDLLLGLAESKFYRTGEIIINESESADKFYWIESGRLNVKISQRDTEEKILLDTLKVGELFGEMALLGIEKRTATVTAKDDSHLYVWTAKDCLSFFEAHKEAGYHVMKNLASTLGSRVRDMNIMLRNYAHVGSDAVVTVL